MMCDSAKRAKAEKFRCASTERILGKRLQYESPLVSCSFI
jgi:hypothetical protein